MRVIAIIPIVVILGVASRARAQQVAPPPTAARAGIRVCAGGDVTLGTNLDTSWVYTPPRRRPGRPPPPRRRPGSVVALPDPDSLLLPLRPLLRDADVVLINVEGAIGEGPAPRKCREGSEFCYAFRQPPRTATAIRRLSDSGAVVGNLANNHAGDAGPEGLVATTQHLTRAGVLVTGTDTIETAVATRRGDTIAILGFSTSAGPDPRDLDAVRRHVTRARDRFPVVVVTMHMGAEGIGAQRTRDTTELFLELDRGNSVAFARAAVASGASLVVGHGPHVMRAAEWMGQALVFYSLGNLVTYGPFLHDEPLNRGAIACAVLVPGGGVRDAALRSTVQRSPGFVRPDRTGRAAALVDSLSRLDFPRTGARLITEARVARP
ncbi:MAG TPA: CapA family protein [Gemmatimonadaceae bacterium]|nr:CapA family protein [Gemmatimonadaceae bacterium]